MWNLNVSNNTSPQQTIVFSDGLPATQNRGERGTSYRLMVLNIGYIDIIDCGYSGDLVYVYNIFFNGIYYEQLVPGLLPITIDITINNDGTFSLKTHDGSIISSSLSPFPTTSQTDIDSFDWMMQNKYIPYQDIPDEPGKTTEEIIKLGLQYFPFSKNSFELAMSLYDWTTADFTRIDFFRIFMYTAAGQELDLNSIAEGIWSANWGEYTPHNVYYMNSFMMQPASSLQDVQNQLNDKKSALLINNESELNIIESALTGMPRTSCIQVPKLYSGQVAIGNLGSQHFATYFYEFPYNSMPGTPLEMPLDEALNTFIEVGKPLTLKSPMAFTNSLDDAMHYSNGIVLIVSPQNNAVFWKDATYITPLSDGPEKIEYIFHPKTGFLIQDIEVKYINGKSITVIGLITT